MGPGLGEGCMAKRLALIGVALVLATFVVCYAYDEYGARVEVRLRAEVTTLLDDAVSRGLNPVECTELLRREIDRDWSFVAAFDHRPVFSWEGGSAEKVDVNRAKKVAAGLSLPRGQIWPRTLVAALYFEDGELVRFALSPIYGE